MNLYLENKVVVLTGATGGIGRQILADFLKEGATVLCLIRNNKKVEDLKVYLDKNVIRTDRFFTYSCNLLDYSAIKIQIEVLLKEHKRIDVLVNCAGSAQEIPFAMQEIEDIDYMLDINLKSPIYLSKAVLKPMFKQKEGSIINISSIAADKKGRGITVYAAAKAGLDNFTRTLAHEVGKKNIRVNCIRPGVIDTNMSGQLQERIGDNLLKMTSLERPGLPHEISKAVLFMASNQTSSFMTGEIINIDGGLY